jgi:thiosulfate/3-mercaptopyruvate sulfurtransferase
MGGVTLISVEELTTALAADRDVPVLLDVRWRLGGPPGYEDYLKGHIPGAVFVDLNRDLASAPGPAGRHPMPKTEAFTAAMRRAGVSAGGPVVVYDAADSMAAARAWWLLRYFGHPDVRVLNGGFRAWVTAGRPVETDIVAPSPGDVPSIPGHMPLLDAVGAAGLARDGLLLDARAAERYRGEVEPVDAVAGHVPGAVSAPTTENVNPDGSFKDRDELADRFGKLGAGEASDVGVYCGSGVTAAHEVLAMELAGIPAALYIGSWSNWVADSTRPISTG